MIWWAKGGALKGDSPARISFLRDVLADAPGDLEPHPAGELVCGGSDGYLLFYTTFMQPALTEVVLPPGEWSLDVLDTWAMTTKPVPGVRSGTTTVSAARPPVHGHPRPAGGSGD